MDDELIEEQRSSNRSAVPYFDDFAVHRERMTALVSAAYEQGPPRRLCVLGAGNAYDLDLAHLATQFAEIHLVDIDETALDRAYARQDPATQARLFLHAPLDLTGLIDKFDAWRRMKVTPEELAAYPETAATIIAERLPGPFDVVVSACVLTQMHLELLSALSSTHRLFEVGRQLLNVAHLRTLSRLLAPGGRAILATDSTSNRLAVLDARSNGGDMCALLAQALASGNVFYAVHPGLLQWTVREDPILSRSARVSAPIDAWLWQNGVESTFLVYAMELTRIAA